MPLPKTEFEVVIEDVVFGGQGLTRIEGKVAFVPDVLPEEKVFVRILKDKGDFFTTRLLKILEPSKQRISPPPGFLLPVTSLSDHAVPYSPGYCYYYTSYKNEVKIKQAQFAAELAKLPSFKKKKLLKPIASPQDMHYRNKITLHFQNDHGERRLGYVMADNSTVLDLPECPLAHPAINAELAALRQKPGFLHTFQEGMTFTLRYTEANGVVTWRNQPPKNMSWLKEETAIGSLSVPAGSFFQVNPFIAPHLVEQVQSWLAELRPEVVFDLFCGVGIFGLAAALNQPAPEMVIGVDADPQGIEAARFNAAARNLENCRFKTGRADDLFTMNTESYSTVRRCLIVDPPRTGLHPMLVRQINDSQIPYIIYISCSPDTLIRDLARLARGGYDPVSFQLADMFPRTAHFETLTLLALR